MVSLARLPFAFTCECYGFIDVVLNFCSSPNGEHLEYFFATAWAIWHNRNQLVHNEKGLTPLQVWDLVRSVVEDFQEVNDMLCSAIKIQMLARWPLRLGISK